MFPANSVIRAKSNVISQMTNAIGKFMLDSNFLRCSFDFPHVIVTLPYLRARDIALHQDQFYTVLFKFLRIFLRFTGSEEYL